ncbi:MAG: DUF4292 domain-containing protein [Bacteroidia bacterium]|nr:DUF4292 domain-containing protein [Bacteroidia bacterium]
MARFALSIVLVMSVGCMRKARPKAISLPVNLPMLLDSLALPSAYTTLRAKYEVRTSQDQTFSMRMQVGGDSVLWGSFSMLGIEGLRLLWNRDSLLILSRLTREAYTGSLRTLRGFLPALGPLDVVALLTGYLPPSLRDVPCQWDSAGTRLLFDYQGYKVQARIRYHPSPSLQAWQFLLPSGEITQITYEYIEKQPIPALSLHFPQSMKMELVPREASFQPNNLPLRWGIPSDYTIQPLEKLLP